MVQSSGLFSSLFLILSVVAVNQLQIPLATCQEEQDVQCLPRRTFLALLRLPEVSSNLAAYSRTARILQDTRNDFVQLKALSTEDTSDDAKICLPAGVYYEIFSDPTMRTHLSAIERALRIIEDPGQTDVGILDVEKRSIATLAKNDDLPASIRPHREEDEEKRSQSSMTPEEIIKMYTSSIQQDQGKTPEEIISEYTLPSGELNVEALFRDFPINKRNIGTLARDYALPLGRRNIAALARDSALPNGKRNIAALARERMLPSSAKRSIASLGRIYILPSYKGKRNIGSLARDSSLPHWGKRNIGSLAQDFPPPHWGKRYLGALLRSEEYPYVFDKKNIASLARNGDFVYGKRNIGTLARDWSLPQSRHSRSLNEQDLGRVDVDLQRLEQEHDNNAINKARTTSKQSVLAAELADAKNKSRSKRQIDYSEEYPLPDMQNVNMSDYEDIIEALAEYPIAEKRFMGAGSSLEMENDEDDDDDVSNQSLGYHDMLQPSRIPQMGPRPTTPPTRRLGR
ncbi:neuropeptide-like 1 isoform X2 [Chelonus insularis]|uniref:neuropeptide-like 1 isoform X2 n=1 Tax=Chelonus insularis TaxID=460826 RepID=UPI00158F6359|nr:neuropeptide-like 1 isoform X2 [Chelonus insularis]